MTVNKQSGSVETSSVVGCENCTSQMLELANPVAHGQNRISPDPDYLRFPGTDSEAMVRHHDLNLRSHSRDRRYILRSVRPPPRANENQLTSALGSQVFEWFKTKRWSIESHSCCRMGISAPGYDQQALRWLVVASFPVLGFVLSRSTLIVVARLTELSGSSIQNLSS